MDAITDWVTAFEEMTVVTGSHKRIRTWGGIACIAGALERRCWVYTAGSKLYPTMYTFLVTPPGEGKSRVLSMVRTLWSKLDGHRIGSGNVSRASLIDDLADAQRIIMPKPGEKMNNVATEEFHSLKVLSSELGVLLPEYANDFMNTLTDIYDGYPYYERKRTKELEIHLENPQINLLAGTTPSYLNTLLPDGAWDQGFISRTMIVFAKGTKRQSLFSKRKVSKEQVEDLITRLKWIGEAYGEFEFTEEAANFVDDWHLSGNKPEPNHPKLIHYNTRRTAHLLKLCMVASISCSTQLLITLDHVQRAMEWMLELEHFLPQIFENMTSTFDGQVIQETLHFCNEFKKRFNKNPTKDMMIKFLSTKVPVYNVERVLDLMTKTGQLRVVTVKGLGETYGTQL